MIQIEENGIDLHSFIKKSEFIVGHSVGLISALFISHYNKNIEIDQLISATIKYVMILTYRCRVEYLKNITNEARQDDLSPMITIRSMSEVNLASHLKKFNNINNCLLEIGLNNADGFLVAVGKGHDLKKFKEYLVINEYCSKKNIIDINFSVPFHSSILNKVPIVFKNDRNFINCDFLDGLPCANILASYDGQNLSLVDDSYSFVAKELCTKQVNWGSIINKSTKNYDILNFFDFGPGALVKLFTQLNIKKYPDLKVKQISINEDTIEKVL